MKKLLTFLITAVLLLAAISAIIACNTQLRNKFLSDLRIIRNLNKSEKPNSFIDDIIGSLQQRASSMKDSTEQKTPDKVVALYFKDGSVMIGELISKTDNEYVINWEGQETVVFAEQIEHVGSPREALKQKSVLSDEEISEWWPFDNDIVIRLTNRVVLDAKIIHVGKDKITVLYFIEDGGRIEQDIDRSEIEYLIFKPFENKESKKIEETLKGLFPKMNFYRMGNFTIVTDSDITWVRDYSQILRNAYTNIYLEFFGLFRDRKPHIQNYIIIFDDYADFFEYAIADGVPGWAVSGYFNPDDKVLYLFNVLGDRFSEILFQAMVGESGRTIDDMVEKTEEYVDERYHIFIEGEAKTIKDKFWKAYSYYKDMFREGTYSTLRHEFAHEIFYNWGLQNIILSKTEKIDDETIKKKKEFLETKDYGKKAELIKALAVMRGQEVPLDMRAANSWLVEGIATYCETNPIGIRNDKWLFLYQEMTRKDAINPLESLTVYRMGSFPGVSSEATLYLYAQSWAYVNFLMEKYPKEFMEYQKKMAEKTAQGFEDVTWLLGCLGKDLRTVDREFAEHMRKFEKLEDPFVCHFERLYNIFNE